MNKKRSYDEFFEGDDEPQGVDDEYEKAEREERKRQNNARNNGFERDDDGPDAAFAGGGGERPTEFSMENLLRSIYGKKAERDSFKIDEDVSSMGASTKNNNKSESNIEVDVDDDGVGKGKNKKKTREKDKEKEKENDKDKKKEEEAKRTYNDYTHVNQFNNTIGANLQPDPQEKEFLAIVLAKLNSKIPTDREVGKDMLKNKPYVREDIKSVNCRICDMVNTDNFNFTKVSPVMNSIELMQKYGLNGSGYANPTQFYAAMAKKFNESEADSTSGREIKALITVDEVAFCCRNHDFMNPKFAIVENILMARNYKEAFHRQSQVKSHDGTSYMIESQARAALNFAKEETNFVKDLMKLDLFYHQIGILKNIHALPGIPSGRGGGRVSNGGNNNAGGGSTYVKTAATGVMRSATYNRRN